MKTKKNIFYILTGLITAGALSVTNYRDSYCR